MLRSSRHRRGIGVGCGGTGVCRPWLWLWSTHGLLGPPRTVLQIVPEEASVRDPKKLGWLAGGGGAANAAGCVRWWGLRSPQGGSKKQSLPCLPWKA